MTSNQGSYLPGGERVESELGFDLEVGHGDPFADLEAKRGVWFHVPANEAVVVAMLSVNPVRFRGHWWDRRFYLCRTGCPFCPLGNPKDPRWAYSVLELGSRRSGFIECGAGTAGDILNWTNRAGALRGLVLKFAKQGRTRFGRIVAVPADAVINPSDLPEEGDVAGALMKSFGSTDTLSLPSAAPRRY